MNLHEDCVTLHDLYVQLEKSRLHFNHCNYMFYFIIVIFLVLWVITVTATAETKRLREFYFSEKEIRLYWKRFHPIKRFKLTTYLKLRTPKQCFSESKISLHRILCGMTDSNGLNPHIL